MAHGCRGEGGATGASDGNDAMDGVSAEEMLQASCCTFRHGLCNVTSVEGRWMRGSGGSITPNEFIVGD